MKFFEVVKHVPQEHAQNCTVEQIVEETDVSVPHVREEIIEVADYAPQERVQNDAVEHVVDVPVTHKKRWNNIKLYDRRVSS